MMEQEKLPPDVVYEILTWCDVNALVSHRLVCKEWPPLLSKSHFINLHLQRTKTIRGFFLQSMRDGHLFDIDFVAPSSPSALPSLKFLPEAVKIEASTGGQTGHGLLCCVNLAYRRPRYYVCKPTTREWTRIPNPTTRFFTLKMGMGIVSMGSPPTFKIVRLSVKENFQAKCNTYHTEVFDSDKWAWERLRSEVVLNFLESGFIVDPEVLINKSLYWLHHPYNLSVSENRAPLVVSFDIETNEWSEVALPKAFLATEEADSDALKRVQSRSYLKLMNIGGELGLLCRNETRREVWVMTRKKNQISWKEEMRWKLHHIPLVFGFFAADVALVKVKTSLQW